MSSLERLPPDQRAVLALVLQRGRTYDEIANLLAIDRAAVRDRALAAMDALGPSEPRVAPERRALITDYLLDQLPPRVRETTREHLAGTASERAWARMLAGELAPMASKPLPEIPAAPTATPTPTSDPEATPEPPILPEPETTPEPELAPEPEPEPEPAAFEPEPATTPEPAAPRREPTRRGTPPPGGTPPSSGRGLPAPVPAGQRASSRLGGGALLAMALVIAVVVVVIILVTNNGSSPKKSGTNTPTSTPTTTTTTGTSTTTTAKPHVIATIIMTPPSGSGTERGAAEIVTEGKLTGVIVAAEHLTPNTKHNAYAVWLNTPGGASHLLGYVSPGVGKKGDLKTSGPLPSNVASYKQILITLETTTNTKTPGPTVLQGNL
jgi:Sigma-70, region 4